MPRRALIPALLLLLALPASAQAAPTAQAAKTCNLSDAEQRGGMGATYQFNPSARNVSCGKAKKVVRAYHDCRGSGKTCGRKVLRFRCRQTIIAESPVQYDARVKCKRGGKRVAFRYTQNT
jgi:uncharacterized protein YyaL (SSP411 family)